MKQTTHLSLLLTATLMCYLLSGLNAQPLNPFTSAKGKRNAPAAKIQGTFRLSGIKPAASQNRIVPAPRPFSKPDLKPPAWTDVQKSANLNPVEQVITDTLSGLPLFIKGSFSDVPSVGVRDGKADPRALYQYLGRLKDRMRISQPEQEFSVESVSTDQLHQTHIKMHQQYNGIPVYGGEIILHTSGNLLTIMNGRYYPTPQLEDLAPAITSTDAGIIAMSDVSNHTSVTGLTDEEKNLLNYDAPSSTLLIYHKDRNPESEKLVWHVTIRPNFIERWEYFIDAKTGSVIDFYNNTCTDGPATASAIDLLGQNRTINTYQLGNTYYFIDASRPMYSAAQSTLPDNPVGAIWTIDANNTFGNNVSFSHVTSPNNSWNNPTAVSAHYNAAVCYQYYLNTHSRNSINGQGGSIISVINLADDGGVGLDNAFWNGQMMVYGNGNVAFTPLAKALDAAGHEMTHGVSQETARLEYRDQSGALNESMSDVFGAMIERVNWKIGEDIVQLSAFPSGALRDMADPHNGGTGLGSPGWQPSHMNEFVNTTQDNGGVHINSGIPNHAFYLLATNTTKEKAEDIYYRALTTYLTQSSQFIDARIAIVQSSTDLFGANSPETNAVKSAFDAVGITNGSGGSNAPHDLALNPGDSYILLTDAPIQSSTKLWATDSLVSGFIPISTTAMRSKVSVPDDGSVAYFVADDGTIHKVTLDASPVETIVDNNPIWHNVAVSKDGLRLALNTETQDSTIYIVDLATGDFVAYQLYNPTTAQGEVMLNVLFSDALEWDYSNQFVMYDAYSVLQNAGGQDIDYWDVGFLNAWNKTANDFGSGNIEKLFSNLPEGISIGNAAFSKNSPNIIAFDLLDLSGSSPQFGILGANLQTGETATIFNNNTLGFPNYSKTDGQLVFTSIQADTIIGIVNLNADKISATGNASAIISLAKWPVWIAQGTRSLIGVPEVSKEDQNVSIYPNPVRDELFLDFKLKHSGPVEMKLFNYAGAEVASWKVSGQKGGNHQLITTTGIAAGFYVIRIETDSETLTKKLVKMD